MRGRGTRRNGGVMTDEVWKSLCSQAGLSVADLTVTVLSRRQDAGKERVLWRIDGAADGPLVAKQSLNGIPEERFRDNISGLSAAGERLSEGRFRAPRVLAVDAPKRAVLMTFAPGVALSRVLSDDTAARAGAWLAAYHATSRSEVRPFRPKFLLDQLDNVTADLPHPARYRAAVAALRGDAVAVRGAEVPVSIRHGDPSVHNLHISPDAVWGMDFMGPAVMPDLVDLGKLVLSVTEGDDTLAARVVDGYGRAIDPALLDFAVRHRALVLWGRSGKPGNDRALHRLTTRMRVAGQGPV